MALRISESDFNEKVLNADKPVLVDFYSDTCIPCKRMAGTLGDIEDDYEGKLYVYKVNVNYEEKLTKDYEVLSAPTLIVFHDGEEKERLSGAAAREDIEGLFNQFI